VGPEHRHPDTENDHPTSNPEGPDGNREEPEEGFVANFAQQVMKGSGPGLWRGLGGQCVELFGRSEALVSLPDHQLPFLDHVHEFNADESGLRRVKRFEP
jgi:hypothetical protein